jgi:hypothetical protein
MASNSNKSFYERLQKLSGIESNSINESNEIKSVTLVDYVRTNDGTAYGVVKENHNYYVKKSVRTSENLNEADFVYINGVENKNEYRFSTLSEAEKQRNFHVKSLNEAWEINSTSFEKKEIETPKLDVPENVSSFLSNRINEGKTKISEEKEIKFKSKLSEGTTENKKKGLIPEAADLAIKKALGLIKEEDLSTADSEIIAGDSVVNMDNHKHEPAQAPINDTNAKLEAEKNDATSGANCETSEESDPFADKEHAGEETGDIVAEADEKGDPFEDDAKVEAGDDISTEDSEEKDTDRVDDEEKFETPQADYHNYNQPEEGYKEDHNVGEKPESDPFDDKEDAGDEKGDIVAEGVENHQEEKEESDPFDDKEDAGEEKADIVSEEEKEAAEALAEILDEGEEEQPESDPFDDKEDAGDEKGDIVAEEEGHVHANDGDAKEQPESDPFDDKEDAGEEKGDIVAEEDDLSTADSEIEAADSVANELDGNIEFNEGELEDGTSMKADDNAIAEDDADAEIEKANDALAGLEDASSEDEPAEAPAAEEPVADDAPAEETPEEEEEEPAAEEEGSDEEPAADDSGEEGDLMAKEIEKLVGKIGQKVRNTDLTPDQAKGHLKSIISAFESDLADVDVEDRKEMSDKILKAKDSGEAESVASGLEKDAENAIEDKIEDLADESGDGLGESMNEEKCDECGTFESYMESRGYSKEDLSECSSEEMTNMVSGYANAYNGGMNDGDFNTVALYVTPEMAESLKEEYGHVGYVEELQPFLDKVDEGQKLQFGTVEPTLAIGEDAAESYAEKFEKELGDKSLDSMSDEEKRDLFNKMDKLHVAKDEVSENDIEFAPVADTIGVQTPLKSDPSTMKSVEVDLNNGKVSVNMSEGEKKTREYIRKRIAEMASGKKSKLDENSNPTLAKLDKLIEEQFNLVQKIKSQLDNE